jgi:hypothetical protein
MTIQHADAYIASRLYIYELGHYAGSTYSAYAAAYLRYRLGQLKRPPRPHPIIGKAYAATIRENIDKELAR